MSTKKCAINSKTNRCRSSQKSDGKCEVSSKSYCAKKKKKECAVNTKTNRCRKSFKSDGKCKKTTTGRCVSPNYKPTKKIAKKVKKQSDEKAKKKVQTKQAKKPVKKTRQPVARNVRARKLHDLAELFTPDYWERGYLTRKQYENALKSAETYVKMHTHIHNGDMIFIGSDYQTRQAYGFCFVNLKKKPIIQPTEAVYELEVHEDAIRKDAKRQGLSYDYSGLEKEILKFQSDNQIY